MMAWWSALSGIEHFFLLLAIPATVLLLIQTILLLFGMGGGGHDAHLESDVSGLEGPDADFNLDAHDVSYDHDADAGAPDATHDTVADAGLRMFTIRGFVAFFSIFGWTGVACTQGGMRVFPSLAIAFAAGLASMLAIAFIMRMAMRLQVNGTISLTNAVGRGATVYMRVPAGRTERGKVNLLVQDSYIEADAVTDESSDLMPGREVIVLGLTTPNTLLVASKQKNESSRYTM